LRPSKAYEIAIIVVELLCPLGNVSIASCDTEFIIGAFFGQAYKLDAGVSVQVD